MLILLEGPDGAGKTTLAEQLVERLRKTSTRREWDVVHYVHRGPPAPGNDLLSEYLLPLANYAPGRTHVVCDRWHLGELVYPGLLQRASLADDKIQFQYLQLFLASRGALLVHVDATYDVLMSRLTARPSVLDYEFEVATQRDRFRHAALSSRLSTTTVLSSPTGRRSIITPTGARSDESPIDHILARAADVEQPALSLAAYPTYVGRSRPEYLIFGDVRGGEQQFPTAFAPSGAHSARYLLETIPSSWLSKIGLVNANEETDIRPLWETLGQPPSVALGVSARATVQMAGVPAGAVPHPQYVKRFHHRYRKAYGDVIQKAMKTGDDLLAWRP